MNSEEVRDTHRGVVEGKRQHLDPEVRKVIKMFAKDEKKKRVHLNGGRTKGQMRIHHSLKSTVADVKIFRILFSEAELAEYHSAAGKNIKCNPPFYSFATYAKRN